MASLSRKGWMCGMLLAGAAAVHSEEAAAPPEKAALKEFSRLGSDDPREREQARTALNRLLDEQDRKEDDAALRSVLKRLGQEAEKTQDPEVRNHWAELSSRFRAGGIVWSGKEKFPGEAEVSCIWKSSQGKRVIAAGSQWIGCYDLETGDALWQRNDFPAGMMSSLAVESGRLLAAADGWCGIYEPETGKTLFQQKDLPGKTERMTAEGGFLVVCGGDWGKRENWVAAYDWKAAKPLWMRKGRDQLPVGPGDPFPPHKDVMTFAWIAAKSGKVLVHGGDEQEFGKGFEPVRGWAACYELATGKPVWERPAGKLGAQICMAIFHGSKRVFLTGIRKRAQEGAPPCWAGSYDLETGKPLWEWNGEASETIFRVCSVGNDVLVCTGRRLVRLSLETGKPVWEKALDWDGAIPFMVWLEGDRVLAAGGHFPGKAPLGCYQAADGKTVWERNLEIPFAVVGGVDGKDVLMSGFTADMKGWFGVYDLETGKELMTLDRPCMEAGKRIIFSVAKSTVQTGGQPPTSKCEIEALRREGLCEK